MFSDSDLQAIGLTFRLAATATAILLLFGTPLAWWLARSRWRYKFLLETLVALPLVLPPTVLGFYLLLALAPNSNRIAVAVAASRKVRPMALSLIHI